MEVLRRLTTLAAVLALGACAQAQGMAPHNAAGHMADGSAARVAPGQQRPALTPPRLLSGPPPTYPKAMIAQGKQGKVTVKCTIEATGVLNGCAVAKLDGDPAFAAAALADLTQRHYRPAMLNGLAVATPHAFVMSYVFAPQLLIPAQFTTTGAVAPQAGAGAARSDVRVTCDVDFEGHAQGCSVSDWSGAMDMSTPAVAFMHRAQLYPASADGVPLAERGASFALTFYGDVPTPTFARAEPLAPGTAVVFVHCTLQTDGTTQDCAIDPGTSDPHFFALAAQFMRDTPLHADPPMIEGVPATQPRFTFLMDFWPPGSVDPLGQVLGLPSATAP
jgi:TonB family protein